MWSLWLLFVAVHAATDPVLVSFYPVVEAGNGIRLHVRPPVRSSTSLPDPYIKPSSIANICRSYAVNSTTQYLGNGTVPDHSADGEFTQTPGEIFCNTGVGVFPENIEQASLNNPFRVVSRTSSSNAFPHFMFLACPNLPINDWHTDPTCDTNTAKQGPGGLVQDCDSLTYAGRQTNILCTMCAWDCNFMSYCFTSVGLPPLPFFDAGTTSSFPSQKIGNNNMFCCVEITRSTDTVHITSTCASVTKDTCGSGGMTATFSASVTWNNTNPKSSVKVQSYRSGFKCDFPCATGTAVSISSCESSDRKTNCFPSVMDQECTVNIREDKEAICPEGGEPIVYKDAIQAAAIGEDAFLFDPLVDTELLAYGQPKQCVDDFERACGDPVCTCVDGCPGHQNCNGQGTWMESVYPNVPSVCWCDDGFASETCASKLPAINCGPGIPASSDHTLFELGFASLS